MKDLSRVVALIVVTLSALLFCSCVRIYVASPDAFSLREPPHLKVSQAIADLRTIGTALEAYSVDYNYYPVVEEKDMTLEFVSLSKVERLESSMVNYLPRVSPDDPWGRPYLYWSLGKSYILLSTGSDKQIKDPQTILTALAEASEPRAFMRTTKTRCLEDEIIFSGGQFLQMPEHSALECSEQR